MSTNTRTARKAFLAALAAVALSALTAIATPTEAQAIPSLSQIENRWDYQLSNEEWDALWDIQQGCYEVVAGRRTSTTFDIDAPRLLGKNDWTADDYNMSVVLEGVGAPAISADFNNQVASEVEIIYSRIVNVLYYEKQSVAGWIDYYSYHSVCLKWDFKKVDGVWHAWIVSATYSINPCVCCEGPELYTVNPAAISELQACIDRAQVVADRHAGETPSRMARSFQDEIHDLASYAYGAKSDQGYYYTDSRPWQFVSVFDDNPSTPAICQGYATAYKLLYELTGRTDTRCRIAMGSDVSYVGRGAHCWAVITMPDGRNYISDPTNNQNGTVGEGNRLLLAPAHGSVEGGYTLSLPRYGDVTYFYDSETLEAYNWDAIAISGDEYSEPAPAPAPAPANDEPAQEEEDSKPVDKEERTAEPSEDEGEKTKEAEKPAPADAPEEVIKERKIEDPDNTCYITFDFDEEDEATSGKRKPSLNSLLLGIAASSLIAAGVVIVLL